MRHAKRPARFQRLKQVSMLRTPAQRTLLPLRAMDAGKVVALRGAAVR